MLSLRSLKLLKSHASALKARLEVSWALIDAPWQHMDDRTMGAFRLRHRKQPDVAMECVNNAWRTPSVTQCAEYKALHMAEACLQEYTCEFSLLDVPNK